MFFALSTTPGGSPEIGGHNAVPTNRGNPPGLVNLAL
jgi:hypothetical protein